MKKKKVLPSKIRLLTMDINVELHTEPIMLDGVECEGLYDHVEEKILIDDSMTDDEKFFIFCHECCHCYLYQLGLTLILPKWLLEIVCNVAAMFVKDLVKGFYQRSR